MPADVVERVEKIAVNKAVNRLVFGDRNNAVNSPNEEDDVLSLFSESDDSDSQTPHEDSNPETKDEEESVRDDAQNDNAQADPQLPDIGRAAEKQEALPVTLEPVEKPPVLSPEDSDGRGPEGER